MTTTELPTTPAALWLLLVDAERPLDAFYAVERLMEVEGWERTEAVKRLHEAAGEWVRKGLPVTQQKRRREENEQFTKAAALLAAGVWSLALAQYEQMRRNWSARLKWHERFLRGELRSAVYELDDADLRFANCFLAWASQADLAIAACRRLQSIP